MRHLLNRLGAVPYDTVAKNYLYSNMRTIVPKTSSFVHSCRHLKRLHPRSCRIIWSFTAQNLRQTCPASLLPWLEYPGSFTRKASQFFKKEIEVIILHEGWGKLKATRHRTKKVWEREIVMVLPADNKTKHSSPTPLLWAKTTVPLSAVEGKLQWVRKLEESPLGKVLFTEPSMRRTRMAIYPTSPTSWGRVSTFLFRGEIFTLEECFLSEFIDLIEDRALTKKASR